MKFYLIEISTGDSKIAGKAIYEYETLNEAVANFHIKMGNAMKSDLFESELLMVINSDLGVHEQKKYVKPNYSAEVVEPAFIDEPIIDETEGNA